MTPDTTSPPGRLTTLTRFAIVGGILAAVVGFFAYLRGVFTPGELTAGRVTDAFEAADGRHPGFRRDHAKGVGVGGYFERTGRACRSRRRRASAGPRFRARPVLARRGNARPSRRAEHGSRPRPPVHRRRRGVVAHRDDQPADVPVPQARGVPRKPAGGDPDPTTGKPAPAKKQALLDRHPETVAALKVITSQPPSSGFANSTFRGLNAFLFTNEAGETRPIRWVLTPEEPFAPSAAAPKHLDKNELFDALIAQLHNRPLRWRLIVAVGEPGDPTNDATLPWPAQRKQVDVGTVLLDHASSATTPARPPSTSTRSCCQKASPPRTTRC